MNLSVQTAVPQAGLIQRFNDLAQDLASHDARLETNERDSRRPTTGWDTWFDDTALSLSSARDGLAQFAPGHPVLDQLARDVVHLADRGGRVHVYQDKGFGFGSGWGSTLDGVIADVRVATNLLLDSGPSFPPPGPGQHLPPTNGGGQGGDSGPSFPPPGPGQHLPPTSGGGQGGGSVDLLADVQQAARLVDESLATIATVPVTDTGDEATKQARISAFHVNRAAQDLLEKHFETEPAEIASVLHTADASLEDAAWQLAKKPSPDGRFNGVDIPGATSDTRAAADVLHQLATSI